MNYKNLQVGEKEKEPGADLGFSRVGSFSFSPTSHELQYIVVTRGFTRLNMKTKYVCRALISLYVNFHNNRTMWSINLHVKICRWGGKEKRALESRGGRIFKNCRKFCRPFFIFFFELCQSTVLSLFWPNFLRRRQNFEKTGQKRRFWALFGKFWPKNCVFSTCAPPYKTSIYWRQRCFYKFFRVHHQKWISQNST